MHLLVPSNLFRFPRERSELHNLQWVAAVVASAALGIIDTSARAATADLVGFDAPAIVVAQPVNPDVVDAPTTGGRLVRLRIPVSTFVSSQYRGQISEYFVEFSSPYQSMRVVDFWPKAEVYSNIEGAVDVERSLQSDKSLGFNASASYEPLARGSIDGKLQNKTNVKQRYKHKPPMQLLTSSGTTKRGYGVFFKFRPGPTPVLEGAREVAILAEVPQGWRADMLIVNMRAAGNSHSNSSRIQPLGSVQLWTITHQEGDPAAATNARRLATQERLLRSLAAASQKKVNQKALPSFWHKIGAALDVVEPKIPENYLSQILFGTQNKYRDNAATNRLPVDLRVAVLDYWDERERLMNMSYHQHSVARVSLPATIASSR